MNDDNRPPTMHPGDRIAFIQSDGTIRTETLKSWSSSQPLFGGLQEVTLTVKP